MTVAFTDLEQRLGRYLDAMVTISRRFTGGFSWTTYGASIKERNLPARDVILRIGEPSGMLAPYTTGPEFLVLRLLHGTAVPVPAALWATDDASVIGAPFMIQEKVRGHVRTPWEQRARPTHTEDPISDQFVDILAALHGMSAPALGEGVRRENAARVQVAHWQKILEAHELRRLPVLHLAAAWLHENAPKAPAVGIVHGDYRCGNFLEEDGRITAILDWELVHLGDPHEDLGWACLRMFQSGPRLICGFMQREALYAKYEAASGRKVSPASVRFYEALSLYKIIAMNVRAARRVEDGTAVDLRMATLAFALPQLMRELLDVMERPQ